MYCRLGEQHEASSSSGALSRPRGPRDTHGLPWTEIYGNQATYYPRIWTKKETGFFPDRIRREKSFATEDFDSCCDNVRVFEEGLYSGCTEKIVYCYHVSGTLGTGGKFKNRVQTDLIFLLNLRRFALLKGLTELFLLL